MKPIRLFFFILLLFYHATLVAFALSLSDSVANNLVDSATAITTITLIGLGLFLVVFGFALFDRRYYQNKLAKLEVEKNEIKAQVYDMKRREDEIDQEIKSFESSIQSAPPETEEDENNDQQKLL
ncbi:MAG: hypothetical protein ACFB15_32560 [Cyclobacteriaceae bacterium]